MAPPGNREPFLLMPRRGHSGSLRCLHTWPRRLQRVRGSGGQRPRPGRAGPGPAALAPVAAGPCVFGGESLALLPPPWAAIDTNDLRAALHLLGPGLDVGPSPMGLTTEAEPSHLAGGGRPASGSPSAGDPVSLWPRPPSWLQAKQKWPVRRCQPPRIRPGSAQARTPGGTACPSPTWSPPSSLWSPPRVQGHLLPPPCVATGRGQPAGLHGASAHIAVYTSAINDTVGGGGTDRRSARLGGTSRGQAAHSLPVVLRPRGQRPPEDSPPQATGPALGRPGAEGIGSGTARPGALPGRREVTWPRQGQGSRTLLRPTEQELPARGPALPG